jgi:hypothetical protein
MNDTDDTGDVSQFEKPAIHDTEVSILNELIFGNWNPDNEVAELYDAFDKADVLSMIETFKDLESWIDGLMKSEAFKQAVLREIEKHVESLKYVIKHYYSGKRKPRRLSDYMMTTLMEETTMSDTEDFGDVSGFQEPGVPDTLIEFLAVMIGSLDPEPTAENYLQSEAISDDELKDTITVLETPEGRSTVAAALIKSGMLQDSLEVLLEGIYDRIKDANFEYEH